jgi:multiple sugar transport system substrate-binding protein
MATNPGGYGIEARVEAHGGQTRAAPPSGVAGGYPLRCHGVSRRGVVQALAGGAAGLAAGALVACEPRAASTPSTSVTAKPVKIHLSTDWNSPTRKAVMDLMKDEFSRKYPNVTIEHEHVTAAGGSAEGYSEKIVASLAADTVPDVVANWAYVPFVEHLVDLTRDAPAAGWRKADVVYDVKNQEVDGKLYMLSMSSAVSGWVYNKTLFQEAGLKEPDDTWTFDQVLEAARKLTKPDKRQYGALAPDGFWFGWLEVVWAAGAGSTGPTSAEMFSAERKKSRLAEAGGLDAFEWYVNLIHKQQVAPTAALAREHGISFETGKIGIRPFGVYNSGATAKQIGDSFVWSAMPIPLYPSTRKRATDLNSEGFVIPKATKRRGTYETALRYTLSFYSDPVQKMVAEQRGTLPIMRKWVESREYLDPPPLNLNVIVKTMNDRQIIVGDHQQRHKAFRQWIAAVRAETNKAFTGENAPRPALQAAMMAGDQVLAAN